MSQRGSTPTSPRSAPPLTSSDPPRPPREDDEAEEAPAAEDDLLAERTPDEEGEGEELIGDAMEADYRAIPALDRYDIRELASDNDLPSEDFDARRRAEEEMDERDRTRVGVGGRRPMVFSLASDDDDRRLRRRARAPAPTAAVAGQQAQQLSSDAAGAGVDQYINWDDVKGVLREHVLMEGPSREIKRQFRNLLLNFTGQDDGSGSPIYVQRIKDMCAANKESLVIDFSDLSREMDVVAEWVSNAPMEMLQIFDEEATNVTLEIFPEYEQIRKNIHVRLANLPIEDKLRDLRQYHLNILVKVVGVVTRRTGVFPQLVRVKFDCAKCGFTTDYLTAIGGQVEVGSCVQCQSRGPFTINNKDTIYRNYQKLTLQETPGTVPAGRLPRYKDVILLADLIDAARPGEEIEVTGIYRNTFDFNLNVQNGFPVFATVIEANYVAKKDDMYTSINLTDEDQSAIRKLSSDERIGEKIIDSIAPSIYGHRDVKTAMALSMFGGQSKNLANHRTRGDINVLVLGDPGTAKSQFLKYCEKTAHRAVYTTGQGASAVGLTAAVRKDPITREWTLEGGALVLADRGVCMIDEFDKMQDQDRTSIHEAMEQQSISISKAGIVTTLQARCAIIAAANPIKGRYDPSIPFSKNVDLTEPILSRFDIMCVVRDVVEPEMDTRLADFIVQSHMDSVADATTSKTDKTADGQAVISQDLLKKYIMFAKLNINPKVSSVDEDKITQLYAELRRESINHGGMPMTVRHIESLIRMAEAFARMHLRDFVRDDDVNMAIRVVLESFIGGQKYQVQNALRKVFKRYITWKKDNNELLLYMLRSMLQDVIHFETLRTGREEEGATWEVDRSDFEAKAREHDIHDLTPFYSSTQFAGDHFRIEGGKIIKTMA